jgi:hypothetical protein
MPDNHQKSQRDDKQQQKKQDMPKEGEQQPISQPGTGRKGDKIDEDGGTNVGNDNDLDKDEAGDDEDQVVTQRNPRVDDDSMKDVE